MTDTQPCTCPDCTGTATHTEPEHATYRGREIRTLTAGQLGLCGPREDGPVQLNVHATEIDRHELAREAIRRFPMPGQDRR